MIDNVKTNINSIYHFYDVEIKAVISNYRKKISWNQKGCENKSGDQLWLKIKEVVEIKAGDQLWLEVKEFVEIKEKALKEKEVLEEKSDDQRRVFIFSLAIFISFYIWSG